MFHYKGIGGGALNPKERLNLQVQLPGLLAEEEYRTNPWGKGMNTAAFYDLILAATGSVPEARRKAKARRAAMIEAGIEPT